MSLTQLIAYLYINVFAQSICVQKEVNMITKRKENKDYGTKQLIEGQHKPGDRVVIVEDIISSGSSILETVLVRSHLNLRLFQLS